MHGTRRNGAARLHVLPAHGPQTNMRASRRRTRAPIFHLVAGYHEVVITSYVITSLMTPPAPVYTHHTGKHWPRVHEAAMQTSSHMTHVPQIGASDSKAAMLGPRSVPLRSRQVADTVTGAATYSTQHTVTLSMTARATVQCPYRTQIRERREDAPSAR